MSCCLKDPSPASQKTKLGRHLAGDGDGNGSNLTASSKSSRPPQVLLFVPFYQETAMFSNWANKDGPCHTQRPLLSFLKDKHSLIDETHNQMEERPCLTNYLVLNDNVPVGIHITVMQKWQQGRTRSQRKLDVLSFVQHVL